MTSPLASFRSLWKDPPRPWHLLLTPAIPLLGLLKDIVWFAPAAVIVVPLALAILASLAVALVVVPMGADRHRSAMAASLLTLTGLSYMTLAVPVIAVANTAVVALLCGTLVLAAIKLIRTPGSAPILTVTANRVVAVAVLLLAAPILWSEWRRPATTVDPLAATESGSTRPDVYVLVLDGYGREDVLRDVFGFQNDLVPYLRATGFHVLDRAAANYSQTALSLASALNGDYIPALNPATRNPRDRRGLGDLINDSRFFRAFVRAGYKLRAYSSEYALVNPLEAHERPAPLIRVNDFTTTLYETTVVPTLLNAVGLERGALPMYLHRRHIDWTLAHLAANAPDGSQPALVFAHILAPHPPFAFDADGGARRTRMPALLGDGDMWHRMAATTGERYESGYLDTLRALNTRVTTAVKAIAARERRAIVLIHSDHGPGSGVEWERPDRTDVRERLSILTAVRFPDGEAAAVSSDLTLVNVYRAVLNRALGTAVPRLEDRSYHSTWERPFDFIDVTERLRALDGGLPGAANGR